jgi:hypothetical protein
LEFIHLLGGFLGMFFVFFLEFGELLGFDGELFLFIFEFIAEFVGVGLFLIERSLKILEVFGCFFEGFLDFLDDFFVFLIFFLVEVSLSFDLNEATFEVDDLLRLFEFGLDSTFLLFHEIVDEVFEFLVFVLFFLE